jgi:hypothetical protein
MEDSPKRLRVATKRRHNGHRALVPRVPDHSVFTITDDVDVVATIHVEILTNAAGNAIATMTLAGDGPFPTMNNNQKPGPPARPSSPPSPPPIPVPAPAPAPPPSNAAATPAAPIPPPTSVVSQAPTSAIQGDIKPSSGKLTMIAPKTSNE